MEEEHIVMQGVEEQQVGTIYEITLRQRWAQFQKFYSSFVEQRMGTIYEITVRHRWAQFQRFHLSFVEPRIGPFTKLPFVTDGNNFKTFM